MDETEKFLFQLYEGKALQALGFRYNVPLAFTIALFGGFLAKISLLKIIIIIPIFIAPALLLGLFFESKYREYRRNCIDIIVRNLLNKHLQNTPQTGKLIKLLKNEIFYDESSISNSLTRLKKSGHIEEETTIKAKN